MAPGCPEPAHCQPDRETAGQSGCEASGRVGAPGASHVSLTVCTGESTRRRCHAGGYLGNSRHPVECLTPVTRGVALGGGVLPASGGGQLSERDFWTPTNGGVP